MQTSTKEKVLDLLSKNIGLRCIKRALGYSINEKTHIEQSICYHTPFTLETLICTKYKNPDTVIMTTPLDGPMIRALSEKFFQQALEDARKQGFQEGRESVIKAFNQLINQNENT